MGPRRKFSGEYKREAVAMLHAPSVTINQIADEMGIGATELGRGQRALRRKLARVTADNAATDSFFGMLKREQVNRQHYQAKAKARADIFDDISMLDQGEEAPGRTDIKRQVIQHASRQVLTPKPCGPHADQSGIRIVEDLSALTT
jgi:transposase